MNVLILSDFSEVAINATHYAINLLQEEQVNFTLLNIYEPSPDISAKSAEAKKNQTLTTLKERVEKLRARSKGRDHNISGQYSENKLVTAARDFVSENKVDLIVMGAVGTEFRHSTILGNHTFEIMSKIKCNILAVAEDSIYKKPEKLLMPVDFAASFGAKNLKFLQKSDFFKDANLNVWEVGTAGNPKNEQNPFHKEVFAGLENLKVRFSEVEDSAIYDKSIWKDVQKKSDLIVLLGKNLKICNRLLHNKHGLYTSVPNRLPILVLHD